MRHIAFVSGPWQCIALLANLQEYHPDEEVQIVLVGPDKDSQAFQCACKILQLFADRYTVIDYGAVKEPEGEARFIRFCDEQQKKNPDYVWVNTFDAFHMQVACDRLDQCPIIFFEDGARTYLNLLQGIPWRQIKIKELIRSRVSKLLPPTHAWNRPRKLSPKRLQRIVKSYLFLMSYLGVPDYLNGTQQNCSPQSLVAIMDAIYRSYPFIGATKFIRQDNDFLLVGQNIYRSGCITRNEELQSYKDVVKLLNQAGFRVLWKDHPRNEEPFFEDLVEIGSDIFNIGGSVSHAWPLELMLNTIRPVGATSIMGSSLFYFRLLLGTPVYTFASRIENRLNEPFYSQAKLFNRLLPDLAELK